MKYREKIDIHTFFGLTYANYLVLRRSMLQSMPIVWQYKFTALLEELNEHFNYPDIPDSCVVTYQDSRGKFIKDPVPHYNRGRTMLTKKDFKSWLKK